MFFIIMTASAVPSSSLGLNYGISVPGSFFTWMWPGRRIEGVASFEDLIMVGVPSSQLALEDVAPNAAGSGPEAPSEGGRVDVLEHRRETHGEAVKLVAADP
jgi:hypothetical protein